MKYYFLVLAFIFSNLMFCQQTKKMNLEEAFRLAEENSLDILVVKNQFQSHFWDNEAFRSEYLPFINLELQPFTFNKQVVQRYNSILNIDEYKNQETLNIAGALSVNQKIPFTGGNLYVETNLEKITAVGLSDYTNYRTTFGRVGITQPLFSYNDYKWKKKLQPLQFSIAKKQFLASKEEIHLKTLNLFFDLISGGQALNIALLNDANAKTLLEIGKKRFEIAGIEKGELLQLELNEVNSTIDVQQMKKMQSFANTALKNYLSLTDWESIEPQWSDLEIVPNLTIEYEEAMKQMRLNNPNIEGFSKKLLEAEQRIAMIKGEGGIKMNLNMSFGIDQQAETLRALYQIQPLDQERIQIGVSIPILDWGKQKRNLERVNSDYLVVKAQIKQEEQEIDKRIQNLIQNFNLQALIIKSATKAKMIADENFNLTNARFKIGETNVINLDAAVVSRQNSKRSYIDAIRNYWEYYYTIQSMAGYDFINKQSLN